MNVGASIRHLRMSKGMTQKELAEAVSVAQAMICQVERGTKTPSLPLSIEIAAALGCELNDIIEGAKEGESA